MLGSPRIVAIDDQREHLTGLASCLNRNGVACLQIYFAGDAKGIEACPDVRVIFADLELMAGAGSNHAKDFATNRRLDRGYHQAGRTVLHRPMDAVSGPSIGANGIPKRTAGPRRAPTVWCPPAAEVPAHRCGRQHQQRRKADGGDLRHRPVDRHRSGRCSSGKDALWVRPAAPWLRSLSWRLPRKPTERSDRLGKILGHLGLEAVGRPHLAHNQFKAINEALLPILADRITGMRLEEHESDLWRTALEIPAERAALPVEEACQAKTGSSTLRTPKTSRLHHVGSLFLLPESYRVDFCDPLPYWRNECG